MPLETRRRKKKGRADAEDKRSATRALRFKYPRLLPHTQLGLFLESDPNSHRLQLPSVRAKSRVKNVKTSPWLLPRIPSRIPSPSSSHSANQALWNQAPRTCCLCGVGPKLCAIPLAVETSIRPSDLEVSERVSCRTGRTVDPIGRVHTRQRPHDHNGVESKSVISPCRVPPERGRPTNC